MTYDVVESQEHGYAAQCKRTGFLSTNAAIKLSPDRVGILGQAVLDRSEATDEALPYLDAKMFTSLKNVLEKSQISSFK